MRKKSFMIIIVALIGISLTLPVTSQARRYGRRGGWGWYGAGAFVGGVVVGSVLARPWYYDPWYYAPGPVYVYPSPPVVYPPSVVYYSDQAYAYPDPAITPKPDDKSSSGQWVEVPGQSVNGKWVPAHKAWAPNS